MAQKILASTGDIDSPPEELYEESMEMATEERGTLLLPVFAWHGGIRRLLLFVPMEDLELRFDMDVRVSMG